MKKVIYRTLPKNARVKIKRGLSSGSQMAAGEIAYFVTRIERDWIGLYDYYFWVAERPDDPKKYPLWPDEVEPLDLGSLGRALFGIDEGSDEA